MPNERKRVKPLYSHAHEREIWFATVIKSFIEKKKENVLSVVLQVLFFLCYTFTNNLHFTVEAAQHKFC